MEMIHLETEAEFASLLEKNPFVVIDFFSTECPPCEKVAPKLERLAKQYAMVQVIKIHRQAFRALAESFDVRSSPTLLFAYRGVVQTERLSGEIGEEEIKRRMDELLGKEQLKVHATTKRIARQERDLCIIGTGPAGLTASVYASRYRIDHVLVGELAGGLMTSSHKICNYPSENEISGMELSKKMMAHVEQLGGTVIAASVVSVKKDRGGFEIVLSNDEVIRAKKILLTVGTKHRHLGVENEDRFVGRGVSYCATCDAAFFGGKTVAVIGGSDSANTASLYLAEIASKVYQIYRGTALRGETAWIEQVHQNEKISVLTETEVAQIQGKDAVSSIVVDRKGQDRMTLDVDGVFIEIGSDPDGRLIQQLGVKVTDRGYVVTKSDQRTSRKNVWAAGDITTGSDEFRQIITACSEGAIAARSIFLDLQKKR